MMKMCAVGVCDAGFGDCDGAAANGCEVVLNTDVAHCGTCMTACMLANATPKCAGGVCQIALCSAGYADCNNKSADGCEINVLGSDLANCGMCGSACTVANGAPKCAMGLCQVASCNMGFGDCDGMAKNGCEVDLTSSLANCGACGMGCNLANAGPLCINSQCAIGTCNMGYSDCNKVAADGCEVNSQTDTANCGACGNPCSTNHGSASCAAGVCKISCAAGFADCNQSVADGCEVNLNGDPANCGGCALACSGANMSVNTCSGGVCTGTCTAGFGDCDGNLRLNGCEINTNTNISNCGGCGKACSGNNGTPSCAAGACSIVCAAGFGNCDGIVANGCEATLTNNNSNCGACGVVCGGGKSCVNSVCVSNTVPAGCLVTANPKIAICISNSKVSTYGAAAAHCAACTEKGLTNACVDVPTCTQGYTNAIVQNLYNTRTGLNCTAQVDQSGGCGWGEIMTPNYQAAGNCPTPQDCTSVNWQSCNAGVGGFDAYIYGVCNLP